MQHKRNGLELKFASIAFAVRKHSALAHQWHISRPRVQCWYVSAIWETSSLFLLLNFPTSTPRTCMICLQLVWIGGKWRFLYVFGRSFANMLGDIYLLSVLTIASRQLARTRASKSKQVWKGKQV